MSHKKLICALDTSQLDQAIILIKRLSPHVGAFKIGHALTLAHGLQVIPKLQDAGADRIFLDLKFHDIPNSVAIAVREAAKLQVWMMTVHLSGGRPMLLAAMEEAKEVEFPPLIVGVSVLTSIDDEMLRNDMGIDRSVSEQILLLSELGQTCDVDGVVCSPQEIKIVREKLGPGVIIVTPGIRPPGVSTNDQKRVGTAPQAIQDGADYLVVGRALTDTPEPELAISRLGLSVPV